MVSSFSEPTDLAPGESGPRLVVTAVDDGPGTTEGATAPITTFAVVPDAAFSSFKLRMYGGTKGLFVHSEDICHPLIANGAGKHEKHAGNKHRAAGRHEVSHG